MRSTMMVIALASVMACSHNKAPAPGGDDSDAAPRMDLGTDASEADASTIADGAANASGPDAGDMGIDAVVSPDAEATGCSPEMLAACAYRPVRPASALADTLGPLEVSYTDVTGRMRTFTYEVRIPANAEPSTPIVIWSHGGASGKDDPSRVANEFGDLMMEGGYVNIAIAHAPRPIATYEDLCRAIGQTRDVCRGGACERDDDCTNFDGGSCAAGQCRYFKPLNWDRPHDFAALLDVITDPESAVAAVADVASIVYAGHSAGAGSTLMVAGAVRQYGEQVHLLHDPRPIAFISGSPQGPEDDGFTAQSFTGDGCIRLAEDPAHCLTRPHLIMTGAGDDTTGHVAEDRREAYVQLPEGDKYLFWNTEEAARHTTFEHKADACERYDGPGAVDAARCQTYLIWSRSAILAFLDAHTRADASASAYLVGDSLELLSAQALEWESK